MERGTGLQPSYRTIASASEVPIVFPLLAAMVETKTDRYRSVFVLPSTSYFFDLPIELTSVSAPVLPLDPVVLVPEAPDPTLALEPDPSLELEPPLKPDRPLDAELPSEPEPPLPDDEPDFDALRLLRQSLNSSENLR